MARSSEPAPSRPSSPPPPDRGTNEAAPPIRNHAGGRGGFLVLQWLLPFFLAWTSTTYAAPRTRGVPSVDGLGQPAARRPDHCVRFRQPVGGGVLHAEAFADLLEAQVDSGHFSHHISASAKRTGLYPLSAWRVPSGNINRIYPGQVVVYRGGSTTATRPSSGRTVTVKRGDTLSGIAARLGISYTQLHGYRSGNPSLTYPGEVLSY